MPIFTALAPDDVKVGRGRGHALALEQYSTAIVLADAGKVELDKDEKAPASKRLLHQAAKELGMRVRSRYEASEHALYWKRVANRTDWGGAAE